MIRNPWRVMWRASRKSPKNFIKYRANLMIGRGIGAAVAKSPMGTANRSPRCFMPVPGIASQYYVCSIEIHTGSHHSCVGGYELIHDSDPASKVIQRELNIGIPKLDGSSLPAFTSCRAKPG